MNCRESPQFRKGDSVMWTRGRLIIFHATLYVFSLKNLFIKMWQKSPEGGIQREVEFPMESLSCRSSFFMCVHFKLAPKRIPFCFQALCGSHDLSLINDSSMKLRGIGGIQQSWMEPPRVEDIDILFIALSCCSREDGHIYSMAKRMSGVEEFSN